MSTTASKVHQLIREAKEFLESGNCTDINLLISNLTDKLVEYHPIVNPPIPLTENPNVEDWRPMVKEGLERAAAEIQTALGPNTKITFSTHIRRAVMKDGGVKAKLSIKFEAKHVYVRALDPVKIIQRNVNVVLASHGIPFAAVLTTSGSQMKFSARVFLEGDEDYTTWKRIGQL